MEHETPDFRATIRRDGAVRIVDWGPWLVEGGPMHALLDARGRAGVAIADLTVVRDDADLATEVIVAFRCGDAFGPRTAIADWARRVGYRRVWFDGDVRDLQPVPGGRARSQCTSCRATLSDASDTFWDFVRHRGAFPMTCVLCGADVPQWRAAR